MSALSSHPLVGEPTLHPRGKGRQYTAPVGFTVEP
jgi:hypothetical protein